MDTVGARACRSGVFIVFLVATCLLQYWPFVTASDSPDVGSSRLGSVSHDGDQTLRKTVMCGPNSLYMLLSLHDVPVNHRVIERYIPSRREGMSLLELKEASDALGLRSQVRRLTIDEFRRVFQSPAIAYLTKDGAHYVVVIGMTDDSFVCLDGTTGQRNVLPNQQWSGYVLMADSGHSLSWHLLVISVLACLVLGFFALKARK
jgi:hypothetical protein